MVAVVLEVAAAVAAAVAALDGVKANGVARIRAIGSIGGERTEERVQK